MVFISQDIIIFSRKFRMPEIERHDIKKEEICYIDPSKTITIRDRKTEQIEEKG